MSNGPTNSVCTLHINYCHFEHCYSHASNLIGLLAHESIQVESFFVEFKSILDTCCYSLSFSYYYNFIYFFPLGFNCCYVLKQL